MLLKMQCSNPEGHFQHLWAFHPGVDGVRECSGTVPGDIEYRGFLAAMNVGRMTYAQAVVALDKVITDSHATSWGQQFLVADEQRRDEAIDWFINICEKIGLLIPHDVPTQTPTSMNGSVN